MLKSCLHGIQVLYQNRLITLLLVCSITSQLATAAFAAPHDFGKDLPLDERVELALTSGLLPLAPGEDLEEVAWLLAPDDTDFKNRVYTDLIELNSNEQGELAPERLGVYRFIRIPTYLLMAGEPATIAETEKASINVADSETTQTPPTEAAIEPGPGAAVVTIPERVKIKTTDETNTQLSIEKRVELARYRGYWSLWPGETLFKIAVLMEPGNAKRQLKLYYEILELNKTRFGGRDPGKINEYALVQLPARIQVGAAPDIPATEPPAQISRSFEPAAETDTTATQPIAQDTTATQPLPEVQPDTISEPTTAAAVTTGYVDQLIDPALAEEPEFDDLETEDAAQSGRRFYNAEYVHFSSDRTRSGRTSENVLNLRGLRETLNYGEFEVNIAANTIDSSIDGTATGSSGIFTLKQRDFALGNGWSMDNAIGLLRSNTPAGIANSYRIQLPSSLVSGIASSLHDSNRDIRFTIGRTGNLNGTIAREFNNTDGLLFNASYTEALDSQWLLGGQWVSLQDHETVPDHDSLAGVAQYTSLDSSQRYQLHTLIDSEGSMGLWVDGLMKHYRMTHFYGVYQLDPELLWSDAIISNDQRGIYYRNDMKLRRQSISAGIDWFKTDIDNNPAREGNDVTSMFLSTTYRKDTRTSIGGTLGYRLTKPESQGDSTSLRATAFATHRFNLGTSRAQITAIDTDQEQADSSLTRLDLTQDWNISRYHQVGMALTYESEDTSEDTRNAINSSVLFRSEITPQFSVNGSLSYGQVDNKFSPSQNIANIRVAAFWTFTPNWQASLEINRNEPEPQQGAGLPLGENESDILLRINYSVARGKSPNYYGRDSEAGGYGKVTGVVFFDENNDGIRQANEKIANNITVFLDGRYSQITDRDGGFEFWPVPSGRHQLGVALEDIPLPWGMQDEPLITLELQPRGKNEVVIPLTRIGE